MPRHIIEAKAESEGFNDVINALARELKADGGGLQPVILERVAKNPPARYVTVIWDRWKKVPEDIRPELIVAAYTRAEGQEASDAIMTAEAVTPAEAVALGLMPYTVIPARRPDSPVTSEAYRKA